MNNRIAIILAAGNQARFKSNVPKALYPLSDNLCPLDLNIQALYDYVDTIYVITSIDDQHYFERYNTGKVKVRSIQSGFGCGDALLRSLLYAIDEQTDDLIVMWGDSIQTKNKVKLLIENSTYDSETFYVPVIKEKHPYVQFTTNEDMGIAKVSFSKYKDPIDVFGYHDLSIFRVPMKKCLYFLQMYSLIYKDGDTYNTQSNEFTFLEIFNVFKNEIKSKLVDLSDSNVIDLAYNTLDEFKNVKNKISI